MQFNYTRYLGYLVPLDVQTVQEDLGIQVAPLPDAMKSLVVHRSPVLPVLHEDLVVQQNREGHGILQLQDFLFVLGDLSVLKTA